MPKEFLYNHFRGLDERRLKAHKLQPKCPKCGHEQQQLIDFVHTFMFKCRICKHTYVVEEE